MATLKGVGVFLCYGHTIWMLRRNPDYKNNDKHKEEWECPGGKIKEGESPEQAVIRETWEETAGMIRIELRQLIEAMSCVSATTKFWRVEMSEGQRIAARSVTEALQRQPKQEREANCFHPQDLSLVIQNAIPIREYNKIMFAAGRAAELF